MEKRLANGTEVVIGKNIVRGIIEESFQNPNKTWTYKVHVPSLDHNPYYFNSDQLTEVPLTV